MVALFVVTLQTKYDISTNKITQKTNRYCKKKEENETDITFHGASVATAIREPFAVASSDEWLHTFCLQVLQSLPRYEIQNVTA